MDVTGAVKYHELYLVTKEGLVYSLKRGTPRLLKIKERADGYAQVNLNGKWCYLHRVVYAAFNGGIPVGLQVRHSDGDKSNNRWDNLLIGSQSDNELDKWKHGTMPHGDTHFNAKLTVEAVKKARQLYADKWQEKEILREIGVTCSNATLNDAIIGRTWKHVPGAIPKRGRTKMKRQDR